MALESRRAVARAGDLERAQLLETNLLAVDLREISTPITDVAARLGPPTLRSLDAIHLATALRTPRIDVFVTLDHRLASAAAAVGLDVVSPR